MLLTVWIWAGVVMSHQSETRVGPLKMDHAVSLQALTLLHYWVAQLHFHVVQGIIGLHFHTYIFLLTNHSGVGRKSFTNHSLVSHKALLWGKCLHVRKISRVTWNRFTTVLNDIQGSGMNHDQFARNLWLKEDPAASWSLPIEIDQFHGHLNSWK